MADVCVVGGGVGGMTAALHLRAAGHAVLLLEKNAALGGKLATRERDGYRFDLGPSLLTLPQVFDDLLRRTAGRCLAETVELRRLDPACRYRFADGTSFDARSDDAGTALAVEALRPGNAAQWRAFQGRAARTWETAQRTFLSGPLDGRLRTLARLRSPRDLLAIDALRTLHGLAARSFADPRLCQWADRYATYSGSDPFRCPATLACIAHIEQSAGVWYLVGGMGALRDALEDALRDTGVAVRTGAAVTRVVVRAGRAAGVELSDGERLDAAAVVTDVDAAMLYGDLLPHRGALRRVRAAGRSTSGFALLLGIAGRTAGLGHHTVVFGDDYRGEFDDLHRRRLPPRAPTLYVCCSAASDPGQAPPGCENWFVLANAPSGGGFDWAGEAPRYADHLLETLAVRGLLPGGEVRFREVMHPQDFAARDGSGDGAIYGTSSNSRRAAFLRPANRGAIPGLYLAGGSSHPGGGLPLVALSGGFAARLADADLRARRRPR